MVYGVAVRHGVLPTMVEAMPQDELMRYLAYLGGHDEGRRIKRGYK
ncbi:MAG: hypothetical protein OXE50_02180 [Chloroflexi bacterium]|nr:hypothetical protein [Chloroflexota bacterium]